MPMKAQDRHVNPKTVAAVILGAFIALVAFSGESLFPSPHLIGRLTTGYRKYLMLVAIVLAVRLVERHLRTRGTRRPSASHNRDEPSH